MDNTWRRFLYAIGRMRQFAGIEAGERIETFTIVTTQANEDVKEIYHRMPVLLRPDQFDA